MSDDADTTRETHNYAPPERLAELYGIGSGTDYEPEKFTEDDPDHGAGWPTAGTRPRIEDADHLPHNKQTLITALETAEAGDLIFIPGWATITLNGVVRQDVNAEDVTLASDRGPDFEGAKVQVTDTLFMQDEEVRTIFDISKPNFRLTGLRLVGPQTTHNDWIGYRENRPVSAFTFNADRPEIDNISGRGWGHTVVNFGRRKWIERPHIHHCDLVDNPQDALGYGVCLRHAQPLIQYNYFNNNRHSIAGSGHADCSYVVRNNLIGPEGILHAIDMHERKGIGGKRISIHHNEVMFTENRINKDPQEAIKLRAIPTDGAQIVRNRFHHPPNKYDENDTGSDGDAILLEAPETPETMADAGVEVKHNFSARGRLEETLGATRPY